MGNNSGKELNDNIIDVHLADEAEGLWLVDSPYVVSLDKGRVKRSYLSRSLRPGILKCNFELIESWEPGRPYMTVCMNGKIISSIFNVLEVKGTNIVNPPKELSVVCSIDKYEKEWYDIFYLVCGRLKGIDLHEWFSRGKQCTLIGSNIAKAMVKVAGTRIFNHPEQSIVELLANSIDSYATLKGKPKVGRFGMGFFSFLYFLIGKPSRCLYITTTTLDKSIGAYTTVSLRIKEIDGSLRFNVRVVDTKTTQTGTHVYLDANTENFTEYEVKMFTEYATYLKYTFTVPIINGFTNKKLTNKYFNRDIIQDVIDYRCAKDSIHVHDHAGGMSLDVILNSLLIPSISTKGLQVSSTQNAPRVNYSFIQSHGDGDDGNDDGDDDGDGIKNSQKATFYILINNVVVVKVKIPKGTHSVFLHLPSSAVLPVTRDDVIISSVYNDFVESVNILTDLAANMEKDLRIVEYALLAYKNFTTNSDNKNIIDNLIDMMYEQFSESLIIHYIDEMVYKDLKVNYLVGTRVNPYTNEMILNKSSLTVDSNIFINKKVVLMPKNIIIDQPSNGSTYSYLFIPYNVHSVKGWEGTFVMTYKYDYLKLVNSVTLSDFEVISTLPETLFPYKVQILQLFSLLENACTVKVNLSSRYTIQSVQSTYIAFLSIVQKYIQDEKFLIFCINHLMLLITSIRQPKSYTSDKRIFGGSYNITIDQNHENFPADYPYFEDLLKSFIQAGFNYGMTMNSEFLDSSVWLTATVIFPGFFTDLGFSRNEKGSLYFREMCQGKYNWVEYTLGRLCIKETYLENFNILKNKAFYEQIRLIYKKFLFGKETLKFGYNESLWKEIPYFQYALTDLKMWVNINLYSEKMLYYPFSIDIKPQFSAKQLINYVFKHDTIDFSALPKESRDLSLQILEISINAGTTKPFLEATLTELIQNSMDAIRLTNPRKKSIDITCAKIDNGMIKISIKDYVGMDINNIIAISIPFYSNKVASEMVTGEMGTGFFNIYRESEFVLIDTIRDNKHTKLVQVPLRDAHGNVFDIDTELLQEEVKGDERGTTISFAVKCTGETDEIHTYNRVFTFCHDVIGAMDFTNIYFNKNIIKQNKRLVYRLDELECYYCSHVSTSYIFTKGVPFAPLYDFFKGKEDIGVSESLLAASRSNIIINIKHGFYTPVQSRTRLNISPENLQKLNIFLMNGLCRVLFEKVYLIFDNPLRSIDERNFLTTNLRDWEFTGNLYQVVPTYTINRNISQKDYYSIMSVYSPRDLLLNFILPTKEFYTFGKMIAMVSEISYDKKSLETAIPKVIAYLKARTVSEDDSIFMERVYSIFTKWVSNKYSVSEATSLIEEKKEKKEKEEERSKKLDAYVAKIAKSYLKIFKTLASKYMDNYDENLSVSVKQTPLGVGAYYTPGANEIVLGSALNNLGESIIEFQQKIPDFIKNNGDLRKNSFFQEIFGYTEPCSTMVHELEHARRQLSHDQIGTHDDITIEAFGNPSQRYIFSEFANVVYLKLVGDGLLTQWLNEIKNISI